MNSIDSKIRKAVSDTFNEMRGFTGEQVLIDAALAALDVDDSELSLLLRFAVSKQVKEQKRVRSINADESPDGELFSQGWLESVISIEINGEPGVIKTRHAGQWVVREQRERRIRNLRKQHRAFDREENRFEQLEVVWQQHPEWMVEQAVESLRVAVG